MTGTKRQQSRQVRSSTSNVNAVKKSKGKPSCENHSESDEKHPPIGDDSVDVPIGPKFDLVEGKRTLACVHEPLRQLRRPLQLLASCQRGKNAREAR